MTLKLPLLQRSLAITGTGGLPTVAFQIWWQRFARQIETNFDSILGLLSNVAAINAAIAALEAAIAALSGSITVEVDLGLTPKTGGKFTIAGSGLTPGKPVMVHQAVGPYTGKGTRADEAEMDQVTVAASVTDATTITAYWSSARRVKGNFKFNYQVSA